MQPAFWCRRLVGLARETTVVSTSSLGTEYEYVVRQISRNVTDTVFHTLCTRSLKFTRQRERGRLLDRRTRLEVYAKGREQADTQCQLRGSS